MSATGAILPLLERHRRQTAADRLHTFRLPSQAANDLDKTITVRLADCDGERNSANMLINRKYSYRGYGDSHSIPGPANGVTFTASSRDMLIGTLSLTVDSEEGLACDKTFKEELDRFRSVEGAKICELTKFAFDTGAPSMQLLASLFHIIFIYGSLHYKCTDLFIEVNPRHRRFYRAMLGFQDVGTVKTNEAVGAPSHLMWLKVSEIRRQIDVQSGRDAVSSHSLYRYFFSRKEELGIYSRLVNEASMPASRMPKVAATLREGAVLRGGGATLRAGTKRRAAEVAAELVERQTAFA